MSFAFFPLSQEPTPNPVNDDGGERVTPETPLSSADPLETGDYYPLSEVTNYASEGLGRLLGQFQNSPRLRELATIYLEQVQELESALWALLNIRDCDVATDQYLDDIGELVHEGRDGLTDALYRKFIKAKIFANVSNANAPDIYNVVRQVLDGGETIEMKILQPATMYMEHSGAGLGATFPAQKLAVVMCKAVAAAVICVFIYNRTDDTDTFQFAPGDVVVGGDTNKGFADTPQATGGHFVNALDGSD